LISCPLAGHAPDKKPIREELAQKLNQWLKDGHLDILGHRHVSNRTEMSMSESPNGHSQLVAIVQDHELAKVGMRRREGRNVLTSPYGEVPVAEPLRQNWNQKIAKSSTWHLCTGYPLAASAGGFRSEHRKRAA
jgi:hypothetical protein